MAPVRPLEARRIAAKCKRQRSSRPGLDRVLFYSVLSIIQMPLDAARTEWQPSAGVVKKRPLGELVRLVSGKTVAPAER